MTSERDKCGLTSLLPISCRDRAEAFARSLQSRLNSLGSQSSSTEERSWLGSHESTVALSQPLHNPETERYLALEMLESPCSPQDEIAESELHRLLNKDSFRENKNGDCLCPKLNSSEIKCNGQVKSNGLVRHYSGDSDSEVFYDLDDDDPPSQPYPNGLTHSESSKSVESETGIDLNSQGTSSSNPSETFATSLDCTPQPSLSDDISTLSLKDDTTATEVSSICEDCEKNREEKVNSIVENCETDACTNNENDEGYVNGDDSSDTYFSNLTVHAELVVECAIDTKHGKIEEVDPSRLSESEKTTTKPEDNDEDDDDAPQRVRRCSSLKTGKTPPGTPGHKKIVRFADVLGLDLADVRTFLDEIPKIPKSAYNDLSDVDLSDASDTNTPNSSTKLFHGIKIDRILVPLFDQPAGLPNFLDLVRDNQVCLENALVEDPILFLIKGTVRVRNLDFHKSVHIRYTLDSWKTFADVQGTYVTNSCDGFSDRFTFTIYAHTLTVGQKIEFACRFQCKGCQYWDSNGDKNYCFQCLPAAATSTAAPVLSSHGHADWGASFY